MEIEYRLYYDETGKPLFYTCEKPEGNFIVIDRQTYAECRMDVEVINGLVCKVTRAPAISRLVRDTLGTVCAVEDITLIPEQGYDGETITWCYRNV